MRPGASSDSRATRAATAEGTAAARIASAMHTLLRGKLRGANSSGNGSRWPLGSGGVMQTLQAQALQPQHFPVRKPGVVNRTLIERTSNDGGSHDGKQQRQYE